MGSKRQLFSLTSLSKDVVECNIALIGELGVGKSALTVKYLTKRFIMEYDPYLEDTYQKNENLEGQEIVLKIMDTCDTADKNPDRYFKWAHGIIVTYSITNRNTFDTARKFLEDINEATKDTTVALVGNKIDLERYRTVSKTEGQELASEYDCLFHETSAADDFKSVERLFHDLMRDITRSQERNISLQPLFISEDSKVGLFNPLSQGISRGTFRRTKSPGSIHDVKDTQNRTTDKDNRFTQRRMPSTFKIFKSRFNIFN